MYLSIIVITQTLVNAVAHHDGEILIVDAVVVDGWFEEMGILLEPWLSLAGSAPHAPRTLLAYHFGRLTGAESIVVGRNLITTMYLF